MLNFPLLHCRPLLADVYKDSCYKPQGEYHSHPTLAYYRGMTSSSSEMDLQSLFRKYREETKHSFESDLTSKSDSHMTSDNARKEKQKTRNNYPGDLMVRDPVVDQLQPPLYRVGAMGSSWRHVKQCFDSNGRFLTFVDGTIKIDDCRRYPPTGLTHIATDMEKIHGAFRKVHEMSKVQLETLGRLMKNGPSKKKAHLIEQMFNPRMAMTMSRQRSPSTISVKA